MAEEAEQVVQVGQGVGSEKERPVLHLRVVVMVWQWIKQMRDKSRKVMSSGDLNIFFVGVECGVRWLGFKEVWRGGICRIVLETCY